MSSLLPQIQNSSFIIFLQNKWFLKKLQPVLNLVCKIWPFRLPEKKYLGISRVALILLLKQINDWDEHTELSSEFHSRTVEGKNELKYNWDLQSIV